MWMMKKMPSESMIQMTVNVGGIKCPPNDTDCIKKQLTHLKKRNDDMTKELQQMETANAAVSIYLDKWVQDNFKTEGGNVGGWEPFAYGGRVGAKGIDTSAKLLQDTGRLRASFLPFATRTNAGIGSDLPYSKDHEEGIGVTRRRILPERSEVWPMAKKIYDNFVKRVIKK